MSKKLSQLDIAVMLAHSKGMSYKQFQIAETLGRVRIRKNQIQYKGKDYV